MIRPTNEELPGGSIEHLSQVIIETLKELSANRQPLSSASLTEALSQRPEVMEILVQMAKSVHIPAPPRTERKQGQESQQAKEQSAQLRNLQTQKDQACRQLDTMQNRHAAIQDFYKRSVFALTALIRSTDNKDLMDSLDRLKKQLVEEVDLDKLEAALSAVKNNILKESFEEKKTSESEPGLLGRWLKRREPPAGASEAQLHGNDHLKPLQDAYLDILGEFNLNLGQGYCEHFSGIQQRIRESRSMDQLVPIHGEILGLVREYTRLMTEARMAVADFVSEISAGLIQMENHSLASLAHTSRTHEANTAFNNVLDLQMEDITHSSTLSRTLLEFKTVVASRLGTIKEAIEQKRREDEARQEEAKQAIEELQQNLGNMRKEVEQIQERTQALELETLLDPLTGAHNRRACSRRIHDELQRYHRYHQMFCVLLYDVDHFKRVNDQYGHRAGDKCLKEIVNRIKPALREVDFLARYGGEEFIVILPGVDDENGLKVAKRLCRLIEKTRFVYQGQEIPLTISIGVSRVKETDETEATLFNRVDKAMYEAKSGGRNQAVVL